MFNKKCSVADARETTCGGGGPFAGGLVGELMDGMRAVRGTASRVAANVLGIETSTDRAVLALATAGGAMFVSTNRGDRRHGRDLIPGLKGLLERAGIAAGEVGAIGVGLGPGSYTGLRVGVTAAKTLAYATGAALIGLDSLHAIARNAPPEAGRVAVIGDAQRGDIYLAELVRAGPGKPLVPIGETRIVALSSWIGGLGPDILVLGPALTVPRIRDALPPAAAALAPDDEANYPRGEHLIGMAREARPAETIDDAWLLEPRYLRRSAAEDQWEGRGPAGPTGRGPEGESRDSRDQK